jgi:ubiquinone/menaquinone biosynthesis C-methylase UbiE
MQNTLQHTKEAFNTAALTFDYDESINEIVKWMRSVVHKIYLENFKPGDKLLELNAGTGIDAMFLAARGIRVHATDISENMINAIKEKVKSKNAENMVDTELCSFENIGQIKEEDFYGAISNFGGLNCIGNFEKLSNDLSQKIKSGGKFIAVVMNKFCPWEIFYYLLKFNFKEAFRRFKKEGIYAGLGNEKIWTYYFSPSGFAKFFSRHFKTKKIYTLGLYTPSPYLFGIYNRFPFFVKLFMKMDNLVMGIYPFNRFGDHFIIILERK